MRSALSWLKGELQHDADRLQYVASRPPSENTKRADYGETVKAKHCLAATRSSETGPETGHLMPAAGSGGRDLLRMSKRTGIRGQRLTAWVFRNATDDTANARRIRGATAATVATWKRTVSVEPVTKWENR